MADSMSFLDTVDATTELHENDAEEVVNTVITLASRYYQFGQALHLPSSKLSEIRHNYPADAEMALNEVILEWLKWNYDVKTYGKPSWKILIEAIDKPAGGANHQLAEEVAAKHLGTPLHDFQHRSRICNRASIGYGTQFIVSHLNSWYFLVATVAVLGVIFYPQLNYWLNLHDSKSLPYLSENFVGREHDMNVVRSLLDFNTKETRIVNIHGPPGFGKSTLAIHVGHKMVREGIVVHYIKIDEFPNENVETVLAEKILESADISVNHVTFDRLLKWARERHRNNLVILDNCDKVLNSQKEQFQNALQRMVESSMYRVKVLMTSREVVLDLQYFEEYKLNELSITSARQLLDIKVGDVDLNETEREIVVNVTGNVPLALHIMGSLLRSPVTPSPTEIIKELQEYPIRTLSPEILTTNNRISTSFNLSYRYLSRNEKVVAQFLAKFPGSFLRDAPPWVYRMYNNFNSNMTILPNMSIDEKQEVILNAMTTLVYRSLLEYDRRANRYHLHSLIKEYFLDREQQNATKSNINQRRFLIGFHFYYGYHYLTALQSEIDDNHVKVLKGLDEDRHNFQKILEDLKKHAVTKYIRAFYTTVNTVVEAVYQRFLAYRFTDKELLVPLKQAANYVHDKVMEDCATCRPHTECMYDMYVKLVIVISQIEERIYDTSTALETSMHHKDVIETFKTSANIHSVMTLRFYNLLATYHDRMDHHEEVIGCQVKIISHIQQHVYSCQEDQCNYKDIGIAYNALGLHEEAALYLERSLKFTNFTTMGEVGVLRTLYYSYGNLSNTKKLNEVFDKLKEKHSVMMVLPLSQILAQGADIQFVIELYRERGYINLGTKLEERLVEAVRETSDRNIPWNSLLNVIDHLYSRENYTKVFELGSYTLQQLNKDEQNNMTDTQLKIKLYVGRAKFLIWNFSSGMDDIEFVYNQMVLQHQDLVAEFRQSCKFLIPRMKYIDQCYNVRVRLVSVLYTFAQFIFLLPFELSSTPLSTPVSETTMYSDTQHMKQESALSKEMVNVENGIDSKMYTNWYYLVNKFWSNFQNSLDKSLLCSCIMLLQASKSLFSMLYQTFDTFLLIILGISLNWIRLCSIYAHFKLGDSADTKFFLFFFTMVTFVHIIVVSFFIVWSKMVSILNVIMSFLLPLIPLTTHMMIYNVNEYLLQMVLSSNLMRKTLSLFCAFACFFVHKTDIRTSVAVYTLFEYYLRDPRFVAVVLIEPSDDIIDCLSQ